MKFLAIDRTYPGVQLLFVSLVFLCTVRADAQWITNPANGHSYRLTEQQYYGIHDDGGPQNLSPTWFDAEAEAQSYGSTVHLVTINDSAENEWLVLTFGGEETWIGFTDHSAYSSEGNWVWASGELGTYTNWDHTQGFQPDNAIQGEDAAMINHNSGNGLWNDLGNDNSHGQGRQAPFRAILERPELVVPNEVGAWGMLKALYR